jgi:cytochrome bd-type quinol oxidase subunit 2
LRFRLSLSDQDFHELYCPVRNTKSALFLVALFSWDVFIDWRGLHKPPEHSALFQLLFGIVAVAIYAKFLVAFTCFRERLLLILIIADLVAWEISGFFAAAVEPYAQTLKSITFVFCVIGLLVSLALLVQSFRTPKVEPSERQAALTRQAKRNLLIVLALFIAILVLSPLIYFFPSPWLRELDRLLSR